MRLLLLAFIPLQLFAQQVEVHINCGGPALGIYSADKYYSGGNSYKTAMPVPLGKSALLETERYGQFAYNIPFRNGPTAITLYFIENSLAVTGVGQRIFSVTVQGAVAIPTLDIFKEVGLNVGYTRTLTTNVTNGILMLYFSPLGYHHNAVLSAIDAVALPILPTVPPAVIGFRPTRAADQSFIVPAARSFACYLNGLRLTEGEDYQVDSISGMVTPVVGSALAGGQGVLTCDYTPR